MPRDKGLPKGEYDNEKHRPPDRRSNDHRLVLLEERAIRVIELEHPIRKL